jgi:hypothetical protein
MKRLNAVRYVLLLSCVLMSGIAAAANPTMQVPAAKKSMTPAASPVVNMTNPCPAGWHKTSGSAGSAFTCAPNKPAPVQCPPKTQYFDSGCSVGCSAIIY